MEKIVITGAKGRLGSTLYEELQHSYDVMGIDRQPGSDIEADIAHENSWVDRAVGAKALIHMALDTSVEYDTSGVVSPDTELMWQNVMRASSELGVRALILCSSVHVDGRYKTPGVGPSLITPIVGKGYPTGAYAENKIRMEKEAARFALETGTAVYLPRVGGYRAGDVVGTHSPTAHLSWISKRDLVQAFQRCIETQPLPGTATVFNAISKNTGRRHSLTNSIGYLPVDDSVVQLAKQRTPTP